jgi:hypothetical protein
MKYIFISWHKIVDGYPESTGCVVNSDTNEIVSIIDRIFHVTTGEFSDEMLKSKEKYNLNLATLGENKDYFFASGTDITPEEAVEDYLEKLKVEKEISDFLTDDVVDELLKLFKK